MLQDGKILNQSAPTDLEGLAAQLKALREDVATLGQSVTRGAERRGRRMASEISEGVGEAVNYVENKGRSADAEFEKAVTAHPLLALGLAAVAGLLIGAMARR